jgi:hypothetical protein
MRHDRRPLREIEPLYWNFSRDLGSACWHRRKLVMACFLGNRPGEGRPLPPTHGSAAVIDLRDRANG